MRVKIEYTVEVDPDVWHEAYGTTTRDEVRRAVRADAIGHALEAFNHCGVVVALAPPLGLVVGEVCRSCGRPEADAVHGVECIEAYL